uniref:adhesion G protein-coupled receptor E1-like n=1 Tax=Jaculus jaculus TaxID=51337 RepID=UPI001E1AFF63|nr:adhesion G protein-coupled receptor E1-like [Jaculus jaculus]
MEFSLYIISPMGTISSLLCLILSIATFLLCCAIQNHNTYIHLHLCLCLFLAKLLFLTGVEKTAHQTACSIIAGFLHCLFLACFFWMLVEAVMLFLMVRNLKVLNYFSSRNAKMLHSVPLAKGSQDWWSSSLPVCSHRAMECIIAIELFKSQNVAVDGGLVMKIIIAVGMHVGPNLKIKI